MKLTVLIHCELWCVTMWDLLLPEAVRNCFLGYTCCADLFTINGSINTPVHQWVHARSWKPKDQTNIFSPYSNVSTTLNLPCGCPQSFGTGGVQFRLLIITQRRQHLHVFILAQISWCYKCNLDQPVYILTVWSCLLLMLLLEYSLMVGHFNS